MKLTFTSGTLEKLSSEYYTLKLYNGSELVYTATIPALDAAALIDKYNNKKVKLVSA